jgi:hypothetical protein
MAPLLPFSCWILVRRGATREGCHVFDLCGETAGSTAANRRASTSQSQTAKKEVSPLLPFSCWILVRRGTSREGCHVFDLCGETAGSTAADRRASTSQSQSAKKEVSPLLPFSCWILVRRGTAAKVAMFSICVERPRARRLPIGEVQRPNHKVQERSSPLLPFSCWILVRMGDRGEGCPV